MTTPPRGGGQNTAKRQKQWCKKLSIEEKGLLGICSFVVHQLGKDALKTSCLCCNCETRSKCAAVLCIFRVSQSHTDIQYFLPSSLPGGNTEMRHWALMMQLQSYRRLPWSQAHIGYHPTHPTKATPTVPQASPHQAFSWKTSKELKKMNALLYRYICL